MATQQPGARSRPLPTVIQGNTSTHGLRDQQTRVSFSSGSCSSNHASGESWFQVSRSIASSQTSHSSHAPLPKGARPPSPQLAQHHTHHARGPSPHHHGQSSHARPASKQTRSRSWRIDWRGVSKVVKWAVLGEQQQPSRKLTSTTSKGRTQSPRSRSRTTSSHRACHQDSHSTTPKHQSKPLPNRPAQSNTDSTNRPPRLASSSAVNLPHDYPRYPSLHSQSDAGHGLNYPGNVAPPSPLPYTSNFQASLPPGTSWRVHGSISTRPSGHVSRNSLISNVQSEQGHAFTDLGHPELDEARFGSRYTISDIGHSSSLARQYGSTPALPTASGRIQYTQSDVGHTSPSAMPGGALSSMSSSTFLNALERPMSLYADSNGPALRSFRAAQSAVALSVSTDSPYAPSTFENRRPRKLRKGIRTGSDAGHSSRLSVTTSDVPGSSRLASARSSSYYTSIKSAPAFSAEPPPKPPPKPARKLTKRNSTPLPPVPKATRSPSSELPPPPVPTKARSILKVNLPPPSVPAKPSLNANRQTSPQNHTSSSEDASTSHEGALVSSPESMTSVSHGCAGTDRASHRPSFLRSESNRRWSVAVADVPDDMLVAELERLRKMGMRAGEVHGVRPSMPFSEELISGKHGDFKDVEKGTTTIVEEVDEDEIEWGFARRAILCCRELVRTERSYQARLQDLYDGNISDEVPKLLLQYLPDLISASRLLSSLFSEDPSAVGVSSAFIEVEPVLENAFVAWTGVVGEFFVGDAPQMPTQKHVRSATISHVVQQEQRIVVDELGRKVKTNVRTMSLQEHKEIERMAFSPSTSASSSSGSSPVQSRSNSQSRRHTSFSNVSGMNWLFRPAFSSPPSTAPSSSTSTSDGRESFSFSLRKSFGRSSRKVSTEKRRRTPFRELAILPTQRVTRYVLLYKDLLKHTPLSSPARGLVERAVSCAQNLAQKCDKAQGNAAFLYSS